jgi:hypothetical protein
MPPELMIRIETEMSRYLFFIVTESMDSSRNIGFKSDEEIRKSIKLTDRLNNQYDPVDPKDISSGVSKLLSLLKPSLQKIFGEFGKGGRFFLFNSVLKDKQEPINVTKINTFKLSWDKNEFIWVLPFSSFLPPKYCPVDKQIMKGEWSYCPIHGVKLV